MGKRLNAHLSLKLLSLSNVWLRLMKLLLKVDVLPWLNSSPASGNWKLSLEAAKAKLVKPSRDSKRLSVVSRSSNSNKMKITRIKMRRLRKLQLSTWLSIARPNKNLRKLRRDPNWLELLSPLLVQLPLVCKLNEIKDFAPQSSSSKQQRLTNQFPGTRNKQQQQLQGLNLQNCPFEHHFLNNCSFLSCLNMKYTACK